MNHIQIRKRHTIRIYKLISLNVQLLGGKNKLSDVFSYLKSRAFDVVCLQHTHFVSENHKEMYALWGNECYFSSYTSNARGTAILFNKNKEIKIHDTKTDSNGNMLALDLTIESKRITLINIYGPNVDTPVFYEGITNTLESFKNEACIICGDFNLVLIWSLSQ